MNFRVTLALVVLVVALAGYVYFLPEEEPSKLEQAGNSGFEIYNRTYGEYDVVELEIDGAQGIAHFARTDQALTQDWKMVRPTPLAPERVDQVRVNGAATRLARLTASQVITGVTNLALYGLESPELTATLTISNGREIVLYTGAETPVNDNRYIRTAADEQTIYLVFAFAVEDLHRLLDEPPLWPAP